MRRRIFFICIFITNLFIFLWVGVNFSFIINLPQLYTSYYAKEMCSCLFVQEQEESFCRSEISNAKFQKLPLLHNLSNYTFKIQRKEGNDTPDSVRIKGLFGTRAYVRVQENKKFGCQLMP